MTLLYDAAHTAPTVAAPLPAFDGERDGRVNPSRRLTVVAQSDPANAADSTIHLGRAGSQSMALAPGAGETLIVGDLAEIWVRGSSAGLSLNLHVFG